MALLTGCIFGKTSKPGTGAPLNPGVHNKVLLKIQGSSNQSDLQLLTSKLTQLPYVHDVATTTQTGSVVICLVSGMNYNIEELQQVAADAGYTILKAGKIVW